MPLELARRVRATSSTAADAHAQSAPLFPQLQRLNLQGVHFHGREEEDAPEPEGAITLVDKHMQALAIRQSAGIPLQEMIITRCHYVQQADVDRLSTLVTVRWDGISLDRDSDEDSEIDRDDMDEDEDEDEDDEDDVGTDYMLPVPNLNLEDLYGW